MRSSNQFSSDRYLVSLKIFYFQNPALKGESEELYSIGTLSLSDFKKISSSQFAGSVQSRARGKHAFILRQKGGGINILSWGGIDMAMVSRCMMMNALLRMRRIYKIAQQGDSIKSSLISYAKVTSCSSKLLISSLPYEYQT